MEIRKIHISKMNPAAYNPRQTLQPDDPRYKSLERSLEEFGYVEPIVWNERTGNIVGGHRRYDVFVAQGQTELDVSVVDMDEQQEKALNLALNKISGYCPALRASKPKPSRCTISIKRTITAAVRRLWRLYCRA